MNRLKLGNRRWPAVRRLITQTAVYGVWDRKLHVNTFKKIKRKFGNTSEVAELEALVR